MKAPQQPNVNPHTNQHYIPGIDGLRAIAVISVLLFHLNEHFLPSGFVGVDIFFVISGYVVTASLARSRFDQLIPFTLAFYKRRILRIYPALIACLLIVSVLKVLFIPASWLSQTTEYTGLLAFFGVSNFALVELNDGYFSPRSEYNVFTHTWSLAVEEQFYFIFPFLIFFWLKYKNSFQATEVQTRLKYFTPIVIIFVLTIGSLLFAIDETKSSADRAFYLLPSRFWELAAGALLFLLHDTKNISLNSSRLLPQAFLLIGLSMVFSSLWFIDRKEFPFPGAISPVLACLMVIHGLVSARTPGLQAILENTPLRYVGKISYSLYLWHWPVYVLLRWTTGLETIEEMSLAVGLSLILSVLSYHLIEQPTRQHKQVRKFPDKQVVVSGIIVLIVLSVFTKLLFQAQSTLSLSVTKNYRDWYPYSNNIFGDPEPDAAEDWTGKRLFVLGDSHAGAYAYLIKKIEHFHHVEVHQFSYPGCATVGLVRPMNTHCKQKIEFALEQVKQLAQPGDVIFLASLQMVRTSDQFNVFSNEYVQARLNSKPALKNREIAFKQAVHSIESLLELNVNILIDNPKPVFPAPPFRCSDWFNQDNPVCNKMADIPKAQMRKHNKVFDEAFSKLQALYPNITVWRNFDILCPTETCQIFLNEKPLFFDGDHLSGYANNLLYPSFISHLRNFWPSK